MAMNATVWSLLIQKSAEETLDVFGTHAEARDALRAFLADNWERLKKGAMPSDLDEAATIYFDLRPEEMALIAPHDVCIQPDAPVV